MSWINYDTYRALVAWLFMLISGILMWFSFNENGQATPLTFFYLFVILLLGLFMLVTIVRHREIISGIDTVIENTPETEEVHEAAIIQNIDLDYVNPLKEIEDFMKSIFTRGKDTVKDTGLNEKVLRALANKIDAVQGLMFMKDPVDEIFLKTADYAWYSDKPVPSFKPGETLPGQVAKNKKLLNIKDIPGGYMTVLSGLGSSSPGHLIIFPLLSEGETVAVIELASFRAITEREEKFIREVSAELGKELGKSIKLG